MTVRTSRTVFLDSSDRASRFKLKEKTMNPDLHFLSTELEHVLDLKDRDALFEIRRFLGLKRPEDVKCVGVLKVEAWRVETAMTHLERQLERHGFAIQTENFQGRTGLAHYDHVDRVITLDERLRSIGRFRSLSHEAAHAVDERGEDDGLIEREAVAEASAYLVRRAVGLDTRAHSLRYLACYEVDGGLLEDLAPRIEWVASILVRWCANDQDELFTPVQPRHPALGYGGMLN